jgi:hypothetical protein
VTTLVETKDTIFARQSREAPKPKRVVRWKCHIPIVHYPGRTTDTRPKMKRTTIDNHKFQIGLFDDGTSCVPATEAIHPSFITVRTWVRCAALVLAFLHLVHPRLLPRRRRAITDRRLPWSWLPPQTIDRCPQRQLSRLPTVTAYRTFELHPV